MSSKNGTSSVSAQAGDLVAVAGHPDTHPLKWAVPDEYGSLPTPRLLKRLTRLTSRKHLPQAETAQLLAPWLADSSGPSSSAVWALESIAWCHLLPRLRSVVPADMWRGLHQLLHDTVAAAAALVIHDDPVRHQLLSAELPLALAFVLPELQSSRDLIVPAGQSLSFALVELLDGDGLLCAAHLPHFRLLLACWTRCRLMDTAVGSQAFDRDAREQYEYMVRQALRATRPDGTLVLSRGLSGDWCPDLLRAALAAGGRRKDELLARLVLPGRRAKKEEVLKRKLPSPSAYSEWGELCVMRASWSRKSPQFACVFANERVAAEVTTAGRVLWSGDVTPSVTVAGQRLAYVSAWTELCWFTDKDVDYLELEVDCQDGWQVQRQMLLARSARFLLLADVILGPHAEAIQYDLRLPLADDIRCDWEGETREGVLRNDRVLSSAVPLSLPEWKAVPARGALEADDHTLHLTLSQTTARLYAPLLFDLAPRRVAQQRTWRQLTVAEDLLVQPHDVAVGYRVQLGYDQWLIYRSLARRGNRSVLGQNLADEFVAARFDAEGSLEALIEVE
jgi:hypothetical protein